MALRTFGLGLMVLLTGAVPLAQQAGAPLSRLRDVTFDGTSVRELGNLSAVLLLGDLIVVADDELRGVLVGRRTAADTYTFGPEVALPISPAGGDPDREFDLEALARDNQGVVAVGSHSARRANVGGRNGLKRSQADNRKRQLETLSDPSRDVLVQFELSAGGSIAGTPVLASLRAIVGQDPILRAFATTPGKENGVDIEGLAIEGQTFWVGFRGPVIRNAYALVLRASNVGSPVAETVLFLPLGGRGVRDLVKVPGGFLLLAGPVGDGDQPEAIYWWNGEDCIIGSPTRCELTMRGELARVEQSVKGERLLGKAEGLAVVATSDSAFEVMVVFDGVPGGAPGIYRVPRR
jgi:hypothetical protein